MKRGDFPPVVITVREPSREVLTFAPVQTIEDPARADRLAAANGVDLVLRKWTRIGKWFALAVGVLVAVYLLTGCAALDRAVPAIGVAHDVAKAGCAILAATDGSSADMLAANQAMSRSIVEASAQTAKDRGADAATIDALVKSIAILSETVKANAVQVVQAAGNGPAKLAPCPATAAAP